MLYLLAVSTIVFSVISSGLADDQNKVPVLLWNIKGNAVQLHSVSAFESGPKDPILKDALEGRLGDDSLGVVVFVVDKISMEDLAAVGDGKNANLKNLESLLDKQPHVLYPSVSDPVKHVRKSSCGVSNVHITEENESSVDKSISSALETSCVVIVHLPDNRHLSSKSFQPEVKDSKKTVVGLFTGRKASWVPLEAKKRPTRSLLSVDELNDPSFFNISGCIYLYLENATFQVNASDQIQLSVPPDVSGSCTNSSSEVKISFTGDDDVKVEVNLVFGKKFSTWSLTNESSVSIEGVKMCPGEWPLSTKAFEAPAGFSFSCGDLHLRLKNWTVPCSIKLNRFQIQPFDVRSDKFDESFDCVPFLTLPIWMGIFVALLLISILNTGIYALFNIKTMDRFDDPKGKTISVPL